MTAAAEWEIGPALAVAYLHAALARADTGTAASRLRLYSSTRPATVLDAHADTPQAEVVLAQPCGAVIDGALVLYPASGSGAMVQAGGMPRWAEWLAGDGALLARCWVTDMEHGGGIRVTGAKTPDGETSPMLYVGGLVQLGPVALE